MISNRVCVIGAGVSGIGACKALKRHGIQFDCYEAGDRVGGVWAYGNSNGMSSAYKSLHVNSSKEKMGYSDYPMPEHYSTFPHHSQIAEYLNNCVEHFNFKHCIHFKTKVIAAEPLKNGGWEVTLEDGSTSCYRALLVANGHHWDPRWPEPDFPGHFDGVKTHSHYYKESNDYINKRVLIVGFGNSAMDIAVELSNVATTYLSVRRGFYITPKHIMGKPYDQAPIPEFLPFEWKRRLYGIVLALEVGDLTQFGLPKPNYKFMHAHPTLHSEILNRLSQGRIKPKPNIKLLDGNKVIFTDDTYEQIDRIIYCTGYKVTFPFFRPEVVKAEKNYLPLFQQVFHLQYRDLFFIGLLQPLNPVTKIAELQGQWVSKYLIGDYTLPSNTQMKKDAEREHKLRLKRYGDSVRHSMEVDYDYIKKIKKEIKRGNRRSQNFSLIQSKEVFSIKPETNKVL